MPGTCRGTLLDRVDRDGERQAFRAARDQDRAVVELIEITEGAGAPYFAGLRDDITQDEAGLQRIFELCNPRIVQECLSHNQRNHVVTNEDDFLLDRSDFEWVRATFGGGRCHHFEHGGHLGTLHTKEVQDEVMAAILTGLSLGTTE